MKRILIATAIAAMSVFGAANMAQADHTPTDPDPHGPYPAPPTTLVDVLPPVLTVPPPITLPVTGTNSLDTLPIAAVAIAVGGGLVAVTKTRRRVAGSAA